MLGTPHQQLVWLLGRALSYDHPLHHQISSNSEITNVTQTYTNKQPNYCFSRLDKNSIIYHKNYPLESETLSINTCNMGTWPWSHVYLHPTLKLQKYKGHFNVVLNMCRRDKVSRYRKFLLHNIKLPMTKTVSTVTTVVTHTSPFSLGYPWILSSFQFCIFLWSV